MRSLPQILNAFGFFTLSTTKGYWQMNKSNVGERFLRSIGVVAASQSRAPNGDLVRLLEKAGSGSHRMRFVTVALLLTLLGATAQPSQAGGWYFSITPPHGQTFDVGPYASHWDCNDMCGSALYSHPFACHFTGLPHDCRIIGNGFAYPKGFPFPVAAGEEIPSNGCFWLNEPPLRG